MSLCIFWIIFHPFFMNFNKYIMNFFECMSVCTQLFVFRHVSIYVCVHDCVYLNVFINEFTYVFSINLCCIFCRIFLFCESLSAIGDKKLADEYSSNSISLPLTEETVVHPGPFESLRCMWGPFHTVIERGCFRGMLLICAVCISAGHLAYYWSLQK